MTTVGILGGGQLARMLALAGAPLGLRFVVMDQSPTACAAQFAPLIVGDYRDESALAEFAARVDVATFDFENVPSASAAWLAERIEVFPRPRALAIAQDRLAEKELFGQLGIETPSYRDIPDRPSFDRAVGELGLPAVLKTRRFGYDGKGQFRLQSLADIDEAWETLGRHAPQGGLILEAFVDFDRELSVLAVRGRDAKMAVWPLIENRHDAGVLATSLAPAVVSTTVSEHAVAMARRLAEALDYVGVFALELFQVGDRLFANEMAPRVHNSGHWTIEGAETSQFENHLRAVCGLPLGSTDPIGTSLMVNFVGDMPPAAGALATPGLHWHDYGKSQRPGRKLGHATLRAPDRTALAAMLRAASPSLARSAVPEDLLD